MTSADATTASLNTFGKRGRGRPKGSKSKTTSVRKLGLHHFRFLSAILQGIGPRWAFDRYLGFTGEGNDIRHIRAKATFLMSEVVALSSHRFGSNQDLRGYIDTLSAFKFEWEHSEAEATGDAEEARQAVIMVEKPTLETWAAEEQIPQDMYTEAELIELYEEAMEDYKPPRSDELPIDVQPQTVQVGATQIEDEPGHASALRYAKALEALEVYLATAPGASDLIVDWLHPPLAKLLKTVGILCIKDLVSYIDVYGFRWHKRVNGIGVARAESLVEWVAGVASALGTPLRETSLRKWTDLAFEREKSLQLVDPNTKVFGIVPLERLAVPEHLSGRNGLFRANGENTLGVNNDFDALVAWLNFYEEKPKTYKTHRWAIEAFALWCLHVARKPISSVDQQDLLAYAKFVTSPPPEWTALPCPALRSTSHWRPFSKGKLLPGSVRQALVSIKAMYSAWMQAGYVTANPVAGVTKSYSLARVAINTDRSFTVDQWAFVNRFLAERPDSIATRRMKLILALGELGLRLSEIASRRYKDLYTDSFARDLAKIPMLRVVGKGDKERQIPAGDHIRALALAHHSDRALVYPLATQVKDGLHPKVLKVEPDPDLPLIFPIKPPPPRNEVDPKTGEKVLVVQLYDPMKQLDPTGLYQAIKRFFQSAATASDDLVDRVTFEKASTHWMRHFFGRLAALNGVEPTAIMDAMGHADLKTTTIYTRPKTEHVIRELSKLTKSLGPGKTGT